MKGNGKMGSSKDLEFGKVKMEKVTVASGEMEELMGMVFIFGVMVTVMKVNG
jgi:hypothetical protein